MKIRMDSTAYFLRKSDTHSSNLTILTISQDIDPILVKLN